MKLARRIFATALLPLQWLGDLVGHDDAPIFLAPNDFPEALKRNLLERLAFYSPPGRPEPVWTSTLTPAMYLSRRPILIADAPTPPAWSLEARNGTYNVDFRHNPDDGWAWCRFARHGRGPSAVERSAGARLRAAILTLRRQGLSRSYLFGTGTSLAFAADRDWSDGYRIVCNTIVRDKSLWHHIKPQIIVAGDAIYHFGFTAFARAFRADLARRLAESEALFAYPAVFSPLVERELAEFSQRLIPIPPGYHSQIEVDLAERFALPSLGNVLNLLLLPLGCTLSRNVMLWGFDGRAPDDKLFWSNSAKHSYPELMPSLLEAHPAFYAHHVPADKPTAYVQSVHGDRLEASLAAAEKNGWRFAMLHKSWTPTLQKRFQPFP